jgi:ammonia channel protein AmtB
VFPVHGVGGTLDTLMAGVFVSTESGVFSGQGFAAADINSIGEQLSVQFIGVLATVVFTAVVTWILLKLTDALVGLRLMKIQRWKVWISVLMKNEATTSPTELMPPGFNQATLSRRLQCSLDPVAETV